MRSGAEPRADAPKDFEAVHPRQHDVENNDIDIRRHCAGNFTTGPEIRLSNWEWLDARTVRSLLQERMMQSPVDANGHVHQDPLEIHADTNAPEEIGGVKIQFPEEFQKVLVVAFRPTQVWVESKSLSPVIKF